MVEDKMDLADWLDDLSVRFINNLPLEELSTAARICFQIEEAQWFYEDFVRPLDPDLPSLNLRHFTVVMFQRCPLLMDYTQEDQERAFQAFLEYKTMVPVRGAIMLNQKMDEVVMVKGWKKNANWSFPRGKIDQNELDLTCALREVYEETGYDLKGSGLVATETESKSIEVQIRGQDLKMYVFRGVPMDTIFVPRTRKEISKVSWHKLADLPILKSKKQQQLEGHGSNTASNAKFYMVAPFLGPLKRWISQQRKLDKLALPAQSKMLTDVQGNETDNITSDQETYNEHLRTEPIDDQHLNRLLQTLRQSSQALSSDLPEVSFPEERPPNLPDADTAVSSAGLKAVLFGAPGHTHGQRAPPYEQRIPQRILPQAVSQHRRQEIPHMRAAHTSTFNPNLGQYPTSPHIPPSVLPGLSSYPERHPQQTLPRMQLPQPVFRPVVDRPGYSIKDKILPPSLHSGNTRVENDPSLGQSAGTQPPIALDFEKSSLLSLFKTDGKASTDPLGTNTPNTSINLGSDGSRRSKSPTVFLPPQVHGRPPEKPQQRPRAPTAQQTKLLDLFRTPSIAAETAELKPPDAQPTAELSASPAGLHSRNNSNIDDLSQSTGQVSKDAVLGQIKIQKRPQSEEGPVSATVTGPLNAPQFDMVRSASREQRHRPAPNQKSAKVSPIQILSRPSSSHTQFSPSSQSSVTVTQRSTVKNEAKQSQAKIDLRSEQASLTEAKDGNLPSKPFQPQILTRPKHSSDNKEPPSSITSPSPKPKTILSRDSKPSSDHKQSLLSLFTKPSPAVSPPTAAPSRRANSPGVVSPIEKTMPSNGKNLDAVMKNGSNPTASVLSAKIVPQLHPQNAGKPSKKYYAPDRMPSKPLSVDTAAPSVTNGGGDGYMSENKDQVRAAQDSIVSPTSSITPANQAYLLSFLKGLK